MFLRSNVFRAFMFFLCFFSLPTWADKHTSPQNNLCHFYEFVKDSNKNSDPANQVLHFIKNRWLELENDLARGYGQELTYLNGLALCPYQPTENFWETQLKGIAYEQREAKFTKIFMSQCFCKRE